MHAMCQHHLTFRDHRFLLTAVAAVPRRQSSRRFSLTFLRSFPIIDRINQSDERQGSATPQRARRSQINANAAGNPIDDARR